jgi:hypothetical protein
MELMGVPFDGLAHMAVGDARNTARVHAEMIRRLRAPCSTPFRSEEGAPAQPTWFGQLLKDSLKLCASPEKSNT